MAKRKLTDKELSSISKNLLERYDKRGFIPYIDDEDPEKEVMWGTESQVIYAQIDKSGKNEINVPKVHFWAGIHMLYANFLWVILFVGLVVFTILLMMYDFDIHKLYRAIKSLFYDYV
ncbi:hypothetical protein JEZ13_09880 [bacterium]|nr:hypothetical protein [bacterium]